MLILLEERRDMVEQRAVRDVKREQWKTVLREQKESGLSAAAFCRERGVSNQSFGYWKKRLAKPAPGAARFRELVVASGKSGDQFYEVVLGSVTIRVPSGFDDEDLRRLLSLVSGSC